MQLKVWFSQKQTDGESVLNVNLLTTCEVLVQIRIVNIVESPVDLASEQAARPRRRNRTAALILSTDI